MKIPERFIVIDDDSVANLLNTIIIKKAVGKNSDIRAFVKPIKAVEYIEAEYSSHPVKTFLSLDINMSGLNGWDVLDKLRALKIRIKDFITIYILSSSIDPRDRERAEANPLVSGFLEKPLSVELVQELCGI